MRELQARLTALAPDGLASLREEVTRRRETAAGLIELKEDPAQVRSAHEAAEARRLEARQALREIEPSEAGAIDAVVAAEAAVAGLEAERSQVEALLGPETTRTERANKLAERIAGSRRGAVRTTSDRRRTARPKYWYPVSAEATMKRVRSAANAAEKEINYLREDIAALTAESAPARKTRLRRNGARQPRRLWRRRREWPPTRRKSPFCSGFDPQESARSHARETYLLPVMSELRPLLELLFDDVSITFDEKTLLPQKLLRNGQEEDVERLSGGMREQLSVLTRLAFRIPSRRMTVVPGDPRRCPRLL